MTSFIKKIKSVGLFAGLLLLANSLQAAPAENEVVASQKFADNKAKNLVATNNNKSKSSQPANTWKPKFRNKRNIEQPTPFFVNMNAGLGLLYFAHTQGAMCLDNSQIPRNARIRRGWSYNRGILSEAVLGWNLSTITQKLDWLSLGLGVLHQGNTNLSIQTNTETVQGNAGTVYTFRANVDFNTVVGKFILSFPHSLIIKTIATNAYLGLSVGPCWQGWYHLNLHNSNGTVTYFENKVSANCFFGADIGFKIRSLCPNSNLSGVCGIKFNYWGQARSMGYSYDQVLRNGDQPFAYFLQNPLRVRSVYQWAPYIGFNMAF